MGTIGGGGVEFEQTDATAIREGWFAAAFGNQQGAIGIRQTSPTNSGVSIPSYTRLWVRGATKWHPFYTATIIADSAETYPSNVGHQRLDLTTSANVVPQTIGTRAVNTIHLHEQTGGNRAQIIFVEEAADSDATPPTFGSILRANDSSPINANAASGTQPTLKTRIPHMSMAASAINAAALASAFGSQPGSIGINTHSTARNLYARFSHGWLVFPLTRVALTR